MPDGFVSPSKTCKGKVSLRFLCGARSAPHKNLRLAFPLHFSCMFWKGVQSRQAYFTGTCLISMENNGKILILLSFRVHSASLTSVSISVNAGNHITQTESTVTEYARYSSSPPQKGCQS